MPRRRALGDARVDAPGAVRRRRHSAGESDRRHRRRARVHRELPRFRRGVRPRGRLVDATCAHPGRTRMDGRRRLERRALPLRGLGGRLRRGVVDLPAQRHPALRPATRRVDDGRRAARAPLRACGRHPRRPHPSLRRRLRGERALRLRSADQRLEPGGASALFTNPCPGGGPRRPRLRRRRLRQLGPTAWIGTIRPRTPGRRSRACPGRSALRESPFTGGGCTSSADRLRASPSRIGTSCTTRAGTHGARTYRSLSRETSSSR